MRPTVNSVKHIVQTSFTGTASGAIGSDTLIIEVDVSTADTPTEVRQGAVVKAIYVERWLRGSDAGTLSTYVMIVEKSVNNSSPPAAGEMAALHTYVNKKNVLFTAQGILNDDTDSATPVIRGWIKIPKGKQRFGNGDGLRVVLFAQSGSIDRCGVAIFKEYF